jgi:DNA-binding LacI/PurR family transcriptional regulator
MQENNYVPAPLSHRRGPKVRQSEQRRIGVWFVGAKAHNPNLNWFQDQLLQVQSSDPRYRVDLRVLFSATPDELPENIARERLDGIILQGMEPSAGCLARLREIPIVWFMTRRSRNYPGDYVEPDNAENGRLAAEYLQDRGHKSVAVISTDPDYSAIVQRAEAFLAHAARIGLAVHSVLGQTHPGGTSYLEIAPQHGESGSLARRLMAGTPEVTGLYLPADHFAGSFFRAMREIGRVPGRDFEAILGNFNPVIYHNLDHSPAAVDINLPLLVRKVMDHLFWRVANREVIGRVGITVSPRLLLPEAASRLIG